jgi:hypothetical protein
VARNRGGGARAWQRDHARARVALEVSYEDRIVADPTFAPLVTGEQTKLEPFHRWLPFRQQFAPALVRRFLEEAAPRDPVLDPFSGSGTVAIECARNGRRGIGVEGIPVLAWLARSRFRGDDDERVAAVLAAGRTVTGDGRQKPGAPLGERLEAARRMIAEDRARPLGVSGSIVVGDARALPLAGGSVGGVLTSPPYLSRYDYSRITSTLDAAWRGNRRAAGPRQMSATLRARNPGRPEGPGHETLPEAVHEAVRAVEERGRRRDAETIRAYFGDLMRTLTELHRVARRGAPVWVVIGAADFEREYIPSDLIAADLGVLAGFEVEGVVEARKLRASLRRLGDLEGVSPRESVVKLVKP